jgi:hypothetical protein
MSLGKHALVLQDFIAKIKSLGATTVNDEIQGKRPDKIANPTQEQAKQLIKEYEGPLSEIRKMDNLVSALDHYCLAFPLIVKDLNEFAQENPPITFVVRKLLVASLHSVVGVFELYFKGHYKLATLEKSNHTSVKERFFSYRLLDYVRTLQITSWFIPVTPVYITPENVKKLYKVLEPLFKAVESDQLYTSIMSKLNRIQSFWKSQAERDLVNQGRVIPG